MALAVREDRALAPSYPRIIRAFIALQLIGGAFVLVMWLTAALHSNIRRFRTWHSFCISWIISSVSYSLLTIAGQQFSSGGGAQVQPSFELCLLQGGLIYAAPTLTAATTLALGVHTYLHMDAILSKATTSIRTISMCALLLTPYFIWASVFLATLFWGAHHPNKVMLGKNGTYCHYRGSRFSNFSSYIVAGLTVMVLMVEGVIARRLYKRRRTLAGSGFSVTMALRVMAFSFIGAVALGVSIAWIAAARHDQGFELVLAIMPVAVALIFGSQADLIRAWMFWKPRISSHQKATSARSSVVSKSSTMTASTLRKGEDV